MAKVLSMITQNAENNTIDIIKSSWNSFDKIIIVDGEFSINRELVLKKYLNIVEEITKKRINFEPIDGKIEIPETFWQSNYNGKVVTCYCSVTVYDKLWIVNREWNDNYAEAYMAHLNLLNEGDWVLIVDSDEYPSELLKQNLDKIIQESDNGNNFDIVMLPVVDYLVENNNEIILWSENDVPQKHINGQWTKSILLRKGNLPVNLRYFGSHVIPEGIKYQYYPYPYIHKRTLNSFLENEVYQAILCPSGQMITETDAAIFQRALDNAKIKTFAEMKNAIHNGKLTSELEMIAIKNRDRIRLDGSLHPFAQIYFSYFLLYGPKNNILPPDNKYSLEDAYRIIKEWKINNHTYKNFGCNCGLCSR